MSAFSSNIKHDSNDNLGLISQDSRWKHRPSPWTITKSYMTCVLSYSSLSLCALSLLWIGSSFSLLSLYPELKWTIIETNWSNVENCLLQMDQILPMDHFKVTAWVDGWSSFCTTVHSQTGATTENMRTENTITLSRCSQGRSMVSLPRELFFMKTDP